MNENITQEENEIINYIETQNPESVPNISEEIKKYQKMATSHTSKKRAINIRLPESDIYILKQKSLQTGLSYQNIIQSLIHQYTQGYIKAVL